MADSNFNPVPLGRSGTGSAVVFGPTTDGLGALRYLEKTDQMQRQIKARAQAAAERQKEAQDNAILSKVKFNTDGGVSYLPMMNEKRHAIYKDIEALATDPTKSRTERQLSVQQRVDDWNAELAAGKANDALVADEIKRYHNDKRYDATTTSKLLTNSLYQRDPDGSLTLDEQGKPQLIPAQQWDSRAVLDGITKGNGHLVGNEVYGQFLDNIPENSVTYSTEALPGGRGYKNVAKSDIYELTPEGKIRRDPKTNRAVLRDSQETLAAFESDKLNKQWLDGQFQQHQQLVTQAAAKTQHSEALTPAEQEAVQLEASPTGARMELFKKDLMRYGYGREETALLQKPARVDRTTAGRTQRPKFIRVGGTEYGTELVGGTAAGGTAGLLALASSDPLVRVKADGTHQPFTAKATHRQYVLLQNGQPGQLVTNNSVPQNLNYTKPQLYLTTPTGNVATPTDPTLQQQYERGNQQPLLNWVRDQREKHPGYALKWHFQAVPATDKLSAQSQAQDIYGRLVAERNKAGLTAGQAGYHGDDELLSTAQKLASQQGATMLIPYIGSDKRDIDRATDYLLRQPKRQRQMQAELERFNSQTAPRPAEQRAAPKKLGIDFGTKAEPATPAAPSPASAKPAPFKRAGNKPTGISF